MMLSLVATVGENFKRIRERKHIKQEQIYKALDYKRPSNVSLLETSKRLPKPRTIQRMAAVLGCEPWELLEGVETPWDELRTHGRRILSTAEDQRQRAGANRSAKVAGAEKKQRQGSGRKEAARKQGVPEQPARQKRGN